MSSSWGGLVGRGSVDNIILLAMRSSYIFCSQGVLQCIEEFAGHAAGLMKY